MAMKSKWEDLRRAFMVEFQLKESYHNLLGSLSSIRQQSQESVWTYKEHVQKLPASIKKSISRCSIAGVGGMPIDLMATFFKIRNLVL